MNTILANPPARASFVFVPAHALLAAILGALALGCGGAAATAGGAKADPHAPSSLYPLRAGAAWSYDVDTGPGGTMLAITRVLTVVDQRVEVTSGTDPVVYELAAEGILRAEDHTWLLKAPIRVGASWPARAGMTAEVTSISERVVTPAGSFEACVRVEERGGERGQEVLTTYCPGVGPVLVESRVALTVSAMPAVVTAMLRGYQVDAAP